MDHPHLRTHRFVAATLVAIGVLALVACSNSGSRALVGSTTSVTSSTIDLPDRPAALQPPPGFRVPDTRNVLVQPVVGQALPQQIPVRGGNSVITGSVVGPDGPVGGANVLIERFVGTASGSITVYTDGTGQFNVTSMLGGRYRVRAWLQPSLATVDAPTGFVADGDHLSFTVGAERHDAASLLLGPAVSAQTVGVPSGVNAQLSQESVDGNGIVHTTGVGGASIQLTTGAPLAIAAPNPAVTNADGRASWTVTCTAAGSASVSAVVTLPGSAAPITATANLPGCADPAPPPTTPTSPP